MAQRFNIIISDNMEQKGPGYQDNNKNNIETAMQTAVNVSSDDMHHFQTNDTDENNNNYNKTIQPGTATDVQVFINENTTDVSEQDKNEGNVLFSKEELYSFSHVQIASLLVPQPKLYKTQHKQWMNILLNAKEGPAKDNIITYIYHSKANSKSLYNYISVPDAFKQSIFSQKDINIANYIKNEPRLDCLPSQYKIIVYGYIRKLKNTYIPKVITELIFSFYVAIIKLFLYQPNRHMTEFDINQQTSTVMRTNISSLWLSNSCKICIPDLTCEDFNMANAHLKGEYYGIFSGNQFVLCSKTHGDTLSFSCGDEHITNGPAELIDYIYCGTQHGIIMSDLDSLYQLQLKDIRADFNMKRLAYKYGFRGYSYAGCSSTCYMRGMDNIFVVQIEKQIGISKVGWYDFVMKSWSTSALPSVGHHTIDDMTEPYCDTIYNYNDRSTIYLLTNDLKLSQYDINRNTWTELCPGDSSCIYSKKPNLWLDNDNVLYSAVLMQGNYFDANVNGYNIVVNYFDVREKGKTWKPHFSDWNDLIVHDADYFQAQLFKYCS